MIILILIVVIMITSVLYISLAQLSWLAKHQYLTGTFSENFGAQKFFFSFFFHITDTVAYLFFNIYN